MPLEFISLAAICNTDGCPNNGIETAVALQLDEHGCVPWVVCGVCSQDIVANPHPSVEETPE